MCEAVLNYVKYDHVGYYEDHMLDELDLRYLWHYTSSDSFLKIIQSKQIRFTDCLFLNDIEEFNYIFTVLDKYIKDNHNHSDFIRMLRDIMDKDNYDFVYTPNSNKNGYKFISGRYYILSGSSDSDSLPLWTYYSKTGKYDGYAVKIDIAKIFHSFIKYGQGAIYAGRVEYNLEKQILIIEEVIKLIIKEYEEKLNELKSKTLDEESFLAERDMLQDDTKVEALDFLNTCRLFFKNSKFSYESELRIAVLASLDQINGNRFDCSFSPINGVIKPSIGLSFNSSFPIESIRIGPIIDKDLAEISIRRLFEAFRININKDFEIDKSKVHIRY